MEIISVRQQEQLPSPPLPPPPAAPKSLTEMTSCLPSPPPLPPQQQQNQTRSNFNSFGRSNTLDRRAYTPKNHNSTSFKLSDPKSNIYQNYNSLERKTITDSSSNTDNQQTNSYRLFNTLNNTRNSLNLTLKPPSPNRKSPAINVNTNSAQIFAKRPLSQDTIQENSACLLDFQHKMSTPTSPDHYNSLAFNNNLQQQQQSSPIQLKQQQQELDAARNQILMLSNQLNNSVSFINSVHTVRAYGADSSQCVLSLIDYLSVGLNLYETYVPTAEENQFIHYLSQVSLIPSFLFFSSTHFNKCRHTFADFLFMKLK